MKVDNSTAQGVERAVYERTGDAELASRVRGEIQALTKIEQLKRA